MTLRILILLAVAAIFPFQLPAQWSLGLSGGANLSFRSWEISRSSGTTGYKHTAGWNVAAFADRTVSPALAFRIESGTRLWRNRMTYSFTQVIGGVNSAFNDLVDESFLVWSTTCMARLTPFPNKNMYLLAGPELSCFVNGLQGFSSSNPNQTGGETISWIWINFDNYPIHRVYYLFNFGFGKSFRLGQHSRLLVECRYQLGPANLSKSELISGKMDAVQLSIGYARILESGKRAQ